MRRIIAKAKRRRTEIEDDEQAALKQIENITKSVKTASGPVRHRDSIPVSEVVNIMSDEIRRVYHDLGSSIDEVNARDKALNLWNDLYIHGNVSAREIPVPHVVCDEHS